MSASMTLTVDARWTNAELEMAVAVLLGLCDGGIEIGPTVANVAAASATVPPSTSASSSSASSSSRYVASRLHESADVWVGLDIALGRYARARREASEGEEANLPTRRREAVDLWSQVFPSGSLSLWLADMEMCDNVGAVQRGMHLRHLLRPAASLHSSRISDDCVLLVVVHQ
jgi:hypothetical protein